MLGDGWTAATSAPLAPTPGPSCQNDNPGEPCNMLYGTEAMSETVQGGLSDGLDFCSHLQCNKGAGQGAEAGELG